MSHLKLVKGSRVDYGVKLQVINAELALIRVKRGNITDEEAVEMLSRAIACLTTAERYILDPNGVWR